MKRIAKLYLRVWSLELQKQLMYQPIMAIFSYVAHVSWVGFSYIFLSIVSSPLAGITQLELLLFLSYFHTVKGLFWIHSSWSSAFLAGSAFKEGKIDFHLVKPVNSQWLVSSFRPNIFAIADLTIGVSSSIYFLTRLGLLTPASLLVFLVSSVLSAVLLYAIWFSYLTFFVPSGEASAVHAVINLFWVFGEYPSEIYRGVTRLIVTVIFPVLLITTLPVSVLLGERGTEWVLVLACLAVVFLYISAKLWDRMLRQYASAN